MFAVSEILINLTRPGSQSCVSKLAQSGLSHCWNLWTVILKYSVINVYFDIEML